MRFQKLSKGVSSFEIGKKKKIKKLQRRLEELEKEKAQTRNYLLWGVMLILGIALVVTGGGDPGGYW